MGAMSSTAAPITTFRGVLGGGGRPGIEGRRFIEAAYEISGAVRPHILNVPTAKASQKTHDSAVWELAEAYKSGADVVSLHAFGERPSRERVLELLEWCDVAYFCGGDTPRLVNLMNELSVTPNLIGAFTGEGHRTACGISAGTLCWFEAGQSDTQSYNLAPGDSWNYEVVPGWGLLPALGGVHYNRFHPQTGWPRAMDFRGEMLRRSNPIGLAVTNQAAWKFSGGMASIVDSESTGQGFRFTQNEYAGLDVTAFAESDGEIPAGQLFS